MVGDWKGGGYEPKAAANSSGRRSEGQGSEALRSTAVVDTVCIDGGLVSRKKVCLTGGVLLVCEAGGGVQAARACLSYVSLTLRMTMQREARACP